MIGASRNPIKFSRSKQGALGFVGNLATPSHFPASQTLKMIGSHKSDTEAEIEKLRAVAAKYGRETKAGGECEGVGVAEVSHPADLNLAVSSTSIFNEMHSVNLNCAEDQNMLEIKTVDAYESSHEIENQADIKVDSDDVTKLSSRGRSKVVCARMMTSIKKSMKMIISCVKPQVDDKSSLSGASEPSSDFEDVSELCPEKSASSMGEKAFDNLSADADEADFDDPPGLKKAVAYPTKVVATSSPITSVSQDSDQFSALEFYRQRVKRYVLSYKFQGPLLPDVSIMDLGKKCLVLDLDETLIHSQFNRVINPDLEVPIQCEYDQVKPIYVCKRPGVDEFLEIVGRHFEVVIFTASLASYADPVIDFLDKTKTIKHRLYRESCVFAEGLYLKDLSIIGRPLDQTILVDNAPTSYLLQPENGVAIQSWFSDQEDTELLGRLLPALLELPRSTDVYQWKKDWSSSINH